MELFIKYWYLVLAIIVSLILTVFVISKAAKSVKLSKIEKEKLIKKLDHEKDLRQSFKVLSNESFSITDKYRLLEGIGMNVQIRVEDNQDTIAAFLALPVQMRYIYALSILFEDCREKPLSFFFKANGIPLTPTALEAVDKIIGGRFFELFRYEYSAFDEENADVSVIKKDIDKADSEFTALLERDRENLLSLIAAYINENKAIFINYSEG
jgi:hypothetical protein